MNVQSTRRWPLVCRVRGAGVRPVALALAACALTFAARPAFGLAYLVEDINTGGWSSSPTYLTDVGGTVFFAASDGTNGTELWKSGGTAAGTVMVKDINPGVANSK